MGLEICINPKDREVQEGHYRKVFIVENRILAHGSLQEQS